MDDHDMTPMEDVRVGQIWAYHDPADGPDAPPIYVNVHEDDGDGAWITTSSYMGKQLDGISVYFVEGDRSDWELISGRMLDGSE